MADQRYLVSARKHRPQIFAELVAQDHVAQTLQNALRLNRLAHAYLFSGPRGVGKTTAARILAKAINCETGEAEPCRTCKSCEDFESGRSMSIFEIDAASNNKVEDVRDLQETVMIPPQGGSRKVYIIDEVHMLSKAAFNALLKTLEEPPPHALFIFATTEPHKVLPTILSRCQRFDFKRIPVQHIVSHLRKICAEEEVTSDEESMLLIARKGDGALRDALSTFDQAVALCGSNLEYPVLTAALGVVTVDHYFKATTCAAKKDSAGMLRLVEVLMSSGHDIQEFLGGLAEHLRNLLVAKSLKEASLIDATESMKERYLDASHAFSEPSLLRMLMVVEEAQRTINTTSHARLRLELMLLKMTRMQDALVLSDTLQRVDTLIELAQKGKLPDAAPSHSAHGPQQRTKSSHSPPDSRRRNQNDQDREKRTRTEEPSRASTEPPQNGATNRRRGPELDSSDATNPKRGIAQESKAKTEVPSKTPASRPDRKSPRKAPAASVSPDSSAIENPRIENWDKILQHFENKRIHVAAVLKQSVRTIKKDRLEFSVGLEYYRDLLKSQERYILEIISHFEENPPKHLSFELRPELETEEKSDDSPFDPHQHFAQRKASEPVIADLAKRLDLSVDL